MVDGPVVDRRRWRCESIAQLPVQASLRALISTGCAAKARGADDGRSLGRAGFGEPGGLVAHLQSLSGCAGAWVKRRVGQLFHGFSAFDVSFDRPASHGLVWAVCLCFDGVDRKRVVYANKV